MKGDRQVQVTAEIKNDDRQSKFLKNAHAPALQASASNVLRCWNAMATGRLPLFTIFGVWFLLTMPPALRRGYHYVEGLTVTVAQSAIVDGHWLTPHMYNLRWIERPMLLSWIIAAIHLPFGHVYPFVARLPVILSLLAGCWLVWRAVRPAGSAGAALLGVGLFLACPIVMRYYSTSVADVPLAVLLFGTFLFWWTAHTKGPISLGHWTVIGCLLAVAALLKGPQPLAYFFLGVGAFQLATFAWRQIPGLVLAGIIASIPVALWYAYVFVPGDQGEWLRYTRLSSTAVAHPHPLKNFALFFFEVFPASLFAATLLITRGTPANGLVPKNFILALTCYALAGTAAVLFWPADVNARYILPMVLPLSVLGGIAYDQLSERRPTLKACGISVVTGLLVYALTHSAVDAFGTPKYGHTKADGARIAEFVRNAPAPIYRTTWEAGLNELPYVPSRVSTIDVAALGSIAKPAWIVVPNPAVNDIVTKSHGSIRSIFAFERATLLRSD